jgi:hypothetical protein
VWVPKKNNALCVNIWLGGEIPGKWQ